MVGQGINMLSRELLVLLCIPVSVSVTHNATSYMDKPATPDMWLMVSFVAMLAAVPLGNAINATRVRLDARCTVFLLRSAAICHGETELDRSTSSSGGPADCLFRSFKPAQNPAAATSAHGMQHPHVLLTPRRAPQAAKQHSLTGR